MHGSVQEGKECKEVEGYKNLKYDLYSITDPVIS